MKFDPKLKGYDIYAIIIFFAVFTAIAVFASIHYLLVSLGLLVMLVLPGYLVMLAMYPVCRTISLAERTALTLGLSILIMPSLGLILNFTPFGIRLLPILILLLVLSICVGAVVIYQRRSIEPKDLFPPAVELGAGTLGLSASPAGGKQPILPLLLVMITIIILIGAGYMMSLLVTDERPTESFTEMNVLTADSGMIPKPYEVGPNETAAVKLSIFNHEGGEETYRLRVRGIPFNSQWELNESLVVRIMTMPDLDGLMELDNATVYDHEIVLDDMHGLESELHFVFRSPGNYQLRFELYKDHQGMDSEPYLEVYFIVIVN